MSTTTLFPAAGANEPFDGRMRRSGTSETWADLRNNAGTSSSATVSTDSCIQYAATTTTDRYDSMIRGGYGFDASAIDDTDIISAATLTIEGDAKGDTGSTNPTVNVYDFTPASTSSVADSDYGNFGSTAYATGIATSALATGGSDTIFTLNATGIAEIDKTGVFFIGLRLEEDADNSAPTWGSGESMFWSVDWADVSGTASDPTLTITHAAPPPFEHGISIIT